MDEKWKHFSTQMQEWVFEMKITPASAATLGFKGQKVKDS